MQIYNLHDLDPGFLQESNWNNIYQVRVQKVGAIRIPLPAKIEEPESNWPAGERSGHYRHASTVPVYYCRFVFLESTI